MEAAADVSVQRARASRWKVLVIAFANRFGAGCDGKRQDNESDSIRHFALALVNDNNEVNRSVSAYQMATPQLSQVGWSFYESHDL